MSIGQVRKSRGLPFLKVGMRVFSTHNGKYGKVTGSNSSMNINVKFDGDNHTQNCHPLWKIAYLDIDGNEVARYE